MKGSGKRVTQASEYFYAKGHRNIRATHRTTFEVTKEAHLTLKGDCIIGVASEKACSDLGEDLKRLLRSEGARVTIKLTSKGKSDIIHAYGSRGLTLTSQESLVVRKSSFIDGRTLAIRADKAAKDLSPLLIEELRRGNPLKIEILVDLNQIYTGNK